MYAAYLSNIYLLTLLFLTSCSYFSSPPSNDQLLYQAAVKAGIHVSDAELGHALRKHVDGYDRRTLRQVLHKQALSPALYQEKIRRRLVVEKFLSQLPTEVVTDEQIKRVFEKSPAKWIPKRIHIRQILFLSAEEAELVRQEVENKSLTFEQAAKLHSIGPEGTHGGDLGWISQSHDWPAVFDSCFSLEPMKVSPVTTSEYGFHLFQVTQEEPAHQEALAEAKTRIKMQLQERAKQAAINKLLKELR